MATKLGGAMRRRKFITLLGGVAALAPFAARAQQRERVPRIGVLMTVSAEDENGRERMAVFRQALQARGWTEGVNLSIDFRWTDDSERLRQHAAELVALAPD